MKNEGKLISKLVESEGRVHNLERENKELKAKLKSTEQYLESILEDLGHNVK